MQIILMKYLYKMPLTGAWNISWKLLGDFVKETKFGQVIEKVFIYFMWVTSHMIVANIYIRHENRISDPIETGHNIIESFSRIMSWVVYLMTPKGSTWNKLLFIIHKQVLTFRTDSLISI